MEWLDDAFGWMAWTWVSGTFFLTIAGMLVCMTVWEVVSPTRERRGFLPISTTRGDRFFIGLLGSAFIHLAWVGLTDAPVYWGTIIAATYMVLMLRYG